MNPRVKTVAVRETILRRFLVCLYYRTKRESDIPSLGRKNTPLVEVGEAGEDVLAAQATGRLPRRWSGLGKVESLTRG
jgi:hypothetical protein